MMTTKEQFTALMKDRSERFTIQEAAARWAQILEGDSGAPANAANREMIDDIRRTGERARFGGVGFPDGAPASERRFFADAHTSLVRAMRRTL
jgi:hypothetical protein